MLSFLLYLFVLPTLGVLGWGAYRWRKSYIQKQKLAQERDLDTHRAFTAHYRSAPRRYYPPDTTRAVQPTIRPSERHREDDDSGSIIAGAALGYALGSMQHQSDPEPAPFEPAGGSFGGGGASESWDSSTSTSVDSSPAAESYTDSSAGDGSGM